MRTVRVHRTSLGPHATTGVLTMDHMGFRLFTLEDPWRNNENGISCVPGSVDGTRYLLERHTSKKYGRTWAMVNHDVGVYHWPGDRPDGVGRFACLCCHSGTHAGHVEGCVIVGLRAGLADLDGMKQPHVFDSRDAVAQFKAALEWEDHELIIYNPEG